MPTLEELANTPLQTRVFNFPNNGHSIRKLCESLYELEDTIVKLHINKSSKYATHNIEVSFIENKYGMNATKLADKLKTLGTRFTLKDELLIFNTEFTDIQSYPDFYL